MAAGLERKPVVFMLDDTQVVLETFLEDINSILTSGEVLNIYEIEAVNGLAAPDGRIFITRGFLKKYYNKEVTASELVSVIAHELGHVALGHSRKRMIDFSGQNAMRVALMMILNRFIPGVGALVANFLTSLLAAKLSRKDEYEADAYASALLTKSDIGIKGQKDLLIKLNVFYFL